MDQARRPHSIEIRLNGRLFTKLVIDPHYGKKHPDMSDSLIVQLVKLLDGRDIPIESTKDEFSYLKVVQTLGGKDYRLILTYCEEDFLGVINAFRVEVKKL